MPKSKYHFFIGGPFSQWSQTHYSVTNKTILSDIPQFVIDGVGYNCAEQYMMAEKARLFNDDLVLEQIMREGHPRDQKAWGRKVKDFDLERWNAVARDVVYRANLAKFTQNLGLRIAMMETDGQLLVEASPTDRIWGIGLDITEAEGTEPKDWHGTNWLGQVCTKVREDIKASENIDWDKYAFEPHI